MTNMENIILGKRYPLSFSQKPEKREKGAGNSSVEEDSALTTFQYVFKPSSIDINKPGSFTVSDSNEVIVALPTLGMY